MVDYIFPGKTDFWYLLKVIFLCFLTLSPTMSAPTTANPPRWINPCGIQGHVFDPDQDMNGAPNVDISENYVEIMRAAKRAKENADDVKKEFLAGEFPGVDIESTTELYRQTWLPEIPKSNEETFRLYNTTDAYRKSFEYLQYFAVGLEQILLDQTLYDGDYINEFQNVEHDLTQVLCLLQMGMYVLKIQPSSDVLRDVMSHQYRDVSVKSERDLRDFYILRDYIKINDFISQLFAYLKTHQPK